MSSNCPCTGRRLRLKWPGPMPLASGQPRGAGRAGGFTLVELLTVITIIAILATLLMTTFSSVKRRAREAVCTSNLHQIGIALHLYLDDFAQRPPDLQTLASSKYLGGGKVMTCPADRSVTLSTPPAAESSRGPAPAQPDNSTLPVSTPAVSSSYQHPLGWSDDEWNKL